MGVVNGKFSALLRVTTPGVLHEQVRGIVKIKPIRFDGVYHFPSRTIFLMLSIMSLSETEGQKASAAPIAFNLDASS